jgi:chromosome segregation ATPase
MSFFKKALGLFVEFEQDPAQNTESVTTSNFNLNTPINTGSTGKISLSEEEIDKFEQHFTKVMDEANMPGPDYYEFIKMMETLEAHVPDERARLGAVFASLAIQGLTKDKLINSAQQYKIILDKDRSLFDNAINDKLKNEIALKQRQAEELDNLIKEHSATIQKLTKEITEYQANIHQLKNDVAEGQGKIKNSTEGYMVAYNAFLNKINSDITKINSSL